MCTFLCCGRNSDPTISKGIDVPAILPALFGQRSSGEGNDEREYLGRAHSACGFIPW